MSASFVYDAAGNRIKGTINGVTTVYIAGIYEYQAGATTQYYEGNAFRRTGYASDNGVFYLLQDHLKSSSAIINQNSTLNSQNYYFPYGGNRGSAFSSLTTKRFTGQYHESSLPGGEGLSYYGARWYDAKLGRFISADTLVPGPANPQTFNRYAYTLNNPLRYIDPSGHGSMCTADPYDPGCVGSGGGQATVRHSVYLPIVTKPRPYVTKYPSTAFSRRPARASTKPALGVFPDVMFFGLELQGTQLVSFGGGRYEIWDFQNLTVLRGGGFAGGPSSSWGFSGQVIMGGGNYSSNRVDPQRVLLGYADEVGVDGAWPPGPGLAATGSLIYGNNVRYASSPDQVFRYGKAGVGISAGGSVIPSPVTPHYNKSNTTNLTVVRTDAIVDPVVKTTGRRK